MPFGPSSVNHWQRYSRRERTLGVKIWKNHPTLDELNSLHYATIHEALGIHFIAIGDDFLEASMPVDRRTYQAAGLLHGGASVVLAESLGSIAAVLVNGQGKDNCVGIEINASHLRGISSGFVVGRVTPIRLGRTLHVWDIQIRDGAYPEDTPRLISQCRLTVMTVSSPKPQRKKKQ